jgi:hypothetical protein
MAQTATYVCDGCGETAPGVDPADAPELHAHGLAGLPDGWSRLDLRRRDAKKPDVLVDEGEFCSIACAHARVADFKAAETRAKKQEG